MFVKAFNTRTLLVFLPSSIHASILIQTSSAKNIPSLQVNSPKLVLSNRTQQSPVIVLSSFSELYIVWSIKRYNSVYIGMYVVRLIDYDGEHCEHLNKISVLFCSVISHVANYH